MTNILTKDLAEDREVIERIADRSAVLLAVLRNNKDNLPNDIITLFALLEFVVAMCKEAGQDKESFMEMVEFEYDCEYDKQEGH